MNVRDDVVYADPGNTEERAEVAGLCVRKLGIEVPALLDDAANSTDQAYTGWPDRLYLIDRNGVVTWKSEPGPFGFKIASLEEEIGKLLRATAGK